MTLQDLLNNRPPKITAEQAAKIMGVTTRFLHMGLQYGKFDFGTAIKMTKRWSYYINTERFIKYMLGKDMEANTNDNPGDF